MNSHQFETTILTILPSRELEDIVFQAASSLGLGMRPVTDPWNLQVFPGFLAIIDPTLFKSGQWMTLCAASEDMADFDSDIRFLLTQPSPHRDQLAEHTVVEDMEEFSVDSLKALIGRLQKEMLDARHSKR